MTVTRILRTDPSRTTTLQTQLMADLARRYRALGQVVRKEPMPWSFVGDLTSKLIAFKAWFDTTVGQLFLPMRSVNDWPEQVGKAYVKGLSRSYREYGSTGSLTDFLQEMTGERRLVTHAARMTPQYRGAYGQFVTERVHLLAERFKTELTGATEVMAQRAARVVADAIDRDYQPSTLGRMLQAEIGVSKNRAMAIARTEIVKAQADGQLDGMEALGLDEVELIAEWLTGGNACPLCGMLSGQTFTLDEARGMIPRHTNCRCAWRMVESV